MLLKWQTEKRQTWEASQQAETSEVSEEILLDLLVAQVRVETSEISTGGEPHIISLI